MNQIQEQQAAQFPHVLIMEDEISLARGLKMVMGEEGYAVDLAGTGKGALDKFYESEFDLLVADLRLPDVDGMDVVEEVKTSKPKTNVIVITGYPSFASSDRARNAGVSQYIQKPFTEEEFMAAVKKALRTNDSMKALLSGTKEEKLQQQKEIMQFLKEVYYSKDFWKALMEKGSDVLKNTNLSPKAKAAIVTGNLIWIKKNIGNVPEEQLDFIYKRLEREVW